MSAPATVIKPVVLAASMIVSTTAPALLPGEQEWNPATPYTALAEVVRSTAGRRFRRVLAGTTATPPENDDANWQDIGPSNAAAMFDRKVGTATRATNSLKVVLRPGAISGLALLDVVGAQVRVTMRMAPGGAVVYPRTVVMDGTSIHTVYEWFFEDRIQRANLVLTDLPGHFHSCEIEIEITGAGEVQCGVCQVGRAFTIGDALFESGAGILDFSIKEADEFGNFDVTERSFAVTNDWQVRTLRRDFNRVFATLASLRSIPCVWIATDHPDYEPMVLYGYFLDFYIAVSNAKYHHCTLQLQGLTKDPA